MIGLRFEWDEVKNLANQRKHGISFNAANQVFLDPLHLVISDRVVDEQQRWHALGVVNFPTGNQLLVLVVHTVREGEGQDSITEVIRIISARKATAEERKTYEGENG